MTTPYSTRKNKKISAEEELISAYRLAEERNAVLAAIVDSSDDAIISKDLNSIITSWNASAERIFGYTAEEMIGESILKLIPLDRHDEEPLILGTLKKGERVKHFETRRLTKNGLLIDVSLTISPVKDNQGNIIGLSKIARDITDKKQEEQRKNDFIAIVSHELKTPLTSIRSYVQLALMKAKGHADDFCVKVLTRAEAQTGKMSTMIHDFLNLSRLEEGKMTLSMSTFCLSSLMKEVITEAEVLAAGHQLAFDSCLEVKVHGDRDKLGQVLTNLLGNAAKYSPAGSLITVDCQLQDSHSVEISVSDQGIGISEEDQLHLFERFYRVKQDLQMIHVSGFGIGLYLVSEILRLHGSGIKLSSKPGHGSVFSFSLPVENP